MPRNTNGPVLACEDMSDDLPRPPLAAVRFLRQGGLKVSLRAWRELPYDVRWAIATEGSRDVIDPNVAQSLLRHLPMRHVELVGSTATPEDAPLPGVLESLGLPEAWIRSGWSSLAPFQRFVLNVLRGNKRLLWRAFAEFRGFAVTRNDGWRGPVAHTEVELRADDSLRRDVLQLLVTERLLDGRALILARASGLRAARSAADLFDLHAEVGTGAVELDWSVEVISSTVLWQAHASDHNGDFYPAASLVGATTAAVCLCDMLKEFDPQVRLRHSYLTEEEWKVGKFEAEMPTAIFDPRAHGLDRKR